MELGVIFSGQMPLEKQVQQTIINSDGTPAKPHSWFISFAPADNPKIAVAVIVENGGYGSNKSSSSWRSGNKRKIKNNKKK